MEYPYPVANNVFLNIENALVDEIVTKDGFKLYLAPEWNFEQNVCVSGTVSSVPLWFKGDISVGDMVAFSYHVVSDRAFPNTSDWFVPVSEGGQYVKIWSNGKGEKLRMMAHHGKISLVWTGTYFDSKGRFQHGTQGSESEVERWLHSNFKFGNCEGFVYKNKISVGGKDYWKCAYTNIFAKKAGDQIISIGDRIICEIIDISARDIVKKVKGIKLPDQSVKLRYYDRGRVISGA